MSKEFQLDVDRDNTIDVSDIQSEFRMYPVLLFRWSEEKSDAELAHDVARAQYEEIRSTKYLTFKRTPDKITEAAMEAMLNTDKEVIEAREKLLGAKRDAETLKNYVESLRAKKDMLIQLGADLRKE